MGCLGLPRVGALPGKDDDGERGEDEGKRSLGCLHGVGSRLEGLEFGFQAGGGGSEDRKRVGKSWGL